MSTISKLLFAALAFTLAFLLLLNGGCGSKDSPTGGKQDLEKLALLASLPLEFAELSDGKIELTFSKDLDKTSFLKGFYIYPPVLSKKIHIEGNVATVKILEPLLADTNYNLILTDRIKDIRGNPLNQNQTLIFKHGKLQTMSVSGEIDYENSADRGLPVAVNILSEDSLWVLTQNVYGSSYSINPLNPGRYLLRAHIDKNRNGKFDSNSEPFFSSVVENQPISVINLNMAYADTVRPQIKNLRAISDMEYEIVFNKPIKTFGSVTAEILKNSSALPIYIVSHESDRITLLTAKTDTTKIRFVINRIEDFKGNKTNQISSIMTGSGQPDKTPPQVVGSDPRNGSTVNSLLPTIRIYFSEIIPSDKFHAILTESDSQIQIPFNIMQADSKVCVIQPQKSLTNYKPYTLIIQSTTADFSGNRLATDYKLSFLPIVRR